MTDESTEELETRHLINALHLDTIREIAGYLIGEVEGLLQCLQHAGAFFDAQLRVRRVCGILERVDNEELDEALG